MKIVFFIQLMLFCFFVWLGAFCVNYTLLHTLHRTIPFLWAVVLTILTGDLSVISAIVIKVLILLGVIAV